MSGVGTRTRPRDEGPALPIPAEVSGGSIAAEVQTRVNDGNRTHTIPDSQSGALPFELHPPSKTPAGIEPACPALQTSASPLGHEVDVHEQRAVQGSNLPTPDLEAGVHAIGTDGAIEQANSQRGRIRTFSPVLPKHVLRQIELHADWKDDVRRMKAETTANAPGGNRTQHSPGENRSS